MTCNANFKQDPLNGSQRWREVKLLRLLGRISSWDSVKTKNIPVRAEALVCHQKSFFVLFFGIPKNDFCSSKQS